MARAKLRDDAVRCRINSASAANTITNSSLPAPEYCYHRFVMAEQAVRVGPSSGDRQLADYMATLTHKQCTAVSNFVQATKEPTSIAVQTLRDCHWDLLEAIGRYGESDGNQKGHHTDTSPAITELVRKPLPPKRHRCDGSQRESPFWLPHAIRNLVHRQAREHPRSPRALMFDPIAALEHLPSNTSMKYFPMFASRSGEGRVWYTAFMRPWESFFDEVLGAATDVRLAGAFDEISTRSTPADWFATALSVNRTDLGQFEMDFMDATLYPV